MNERVIAGRRVLGETVEIDYGRTLEFFEGRADKAAVPDALTTVLYQDAHPEVAAARHEHEIRTITPLLGLGRRPRVLDIGCGNGRWARALAESVTSYLGIDFSPQLIEQARASTAMVADATDLHFQVLSATELAGAPLDVTPPFGLVVVAGVLVYLNDEDAGRVLATLPALLAEDAVVYLREPVATDRRLTLAAYSSDELGAEYSAVYRRASFYRARLDEALGAAGLEFALDEALPTSLGNRAETTQHFFVMKPRR